MDDKKANSIIKDKMKDMEVTEPYQKVTVDTISSAVKSKVSVKLLKKKYGKTESTDQDLMTQFKEKVTNRAKEERSGKITVKLVKSTDKKADDRQANKKMTVILDENGIVGMQG
ncbi:MAG TPA: hypothetical protein VIN08_01995 [Ohtaekwangia sp.]|uniref:hypothetical protein n=1 Tax=Ohtaekwangia sp. TaxID=2066019 RepID=UPI002F91C007